MVRGMGNLSSSINWRRSRVGGEQERGGGDCPPGFRRHSINPIYLSSAASTPPTPTNDVIPMPAIPLHRPSMLFLTNLSLFHHSFKDGFTLRNAVGVGGAGWWVEGGLVSALPGKNVTVYSSTLLALRGGCR